MVAQLALKLAMAWPERVASLTLIEPALFHLLRDGGQLERQMYADIAEVEVRLRKAVAAGDAEAGVASFHRLLVRCRRALPH